MSDDNYVDLAGFPQSRSDKVAKFGQFLSDQTDKIATDIGQKHAGFKRVLKRHVKRLPKLEERSRRLLSAGTLAGLMLTLPGAKTEITEAEKSTQQSIDVNNSDVLPPINVSEALGGLLNTSAKPSETTLEQAAGVVSDAFNIKAVTQLEGHRLNVVYSIMGGEQHLRRYPGDTAVNHKSEGITDGAGGMAPGNGSYGMWANSKAELTPKMIEQERYYVAVETFLAPGFRQNPNEVYNWFRYRKMVAVNPKTGQAVVVVVGDAGPASWTGKSSGGSPEVLDKLGLGAGPRKGAVLLYFIDDPTDSVPLGPISSMPRKATVEELTGVKVALPPTPGALVDVVK